MATLNLAVKTDEEKSIKAYLEKNASEVLAKKINNGVRIVEDGKTLINKKSIETFMKYACEEARKQAEKNARFACIANDTVFGWAIHYFEEDSIEGTLYNQDGTEHKPVVKTAAPTVKPAVKPIEVTPPKPKNMTLFDLVDAKTGEVKPRPEPVEEPESIEEEQETMLDEFARESAELEKQGSDIYDLGDF